MNLWRVYKQDADLRLRCYDYETVLHSLLQTKTPHYRQPVLNTWFRKSQQNGGKRSRLSDRKLSRLIDYYKSRARGNVLLMRKLDVVKKASEFSRIYGIQFEEVFTRGSQFKVC